MRRLFVFVTGTLAMALGVNPGAVAQDFGFPGRQTGLRLVESDGGSETLIVSVGALRLEPIEIEGETWAVVQAPASHNLMDRGRPSLPYLATEYLLGTTGGIRLELVDAVTREIDLSQYGYAGVAPSKGHFDRSVDPDSIPWVFDPKVYDSDASYPWVEAWVDDPFIAGPLRGQALRVPLVTWRGRSNVLTVLEEATYSVVHTPTAPNPRLGGAGALTGLFDLAARQNAVNYASTIGRYDPFVETGRLLILAYDDFIEEVQPLAEWETLVGYPTVVVPKSAAGSTANAIKSYIQGLYDEPAGLTWIILVGDYGQIPNLAGVYQGAPCDACYTKLEGADNRPDAAISRISAENEAQVITQVAKILNYEQNPDLGVSAAWYSKGFGIAGDDMGSTPLADWERMELLRNDLLSPAYNYTEFDQIYHSSATAAQVTTAVNDGRSLGLYIGHGSATAWGTTGFSVTNVNALTNGSMLPVVWDVACDNGAFNYSGGDCFAEAWLKKDGGGAISFEAATTGESWVPPCNAQRGIIDSLRLGTAFTTGGQHTNGKLYCLDTDGETDGSEGTKFMEQSTLFGSCVTWPRTLEPSVPDEPLDFDGSGGIASLTVSVGGTTLAQAGAAIVSFYEEAGATINVLGSGLIDSSGVVHASVSGDPTHCHIYGNNLVASSFELAARPEGRVSLDHEAYACASTASIRVSDSNVPGSSPGSIDTVSVNLGTGVDSIVVALTETGVDKNIYTGAAVLGTDLVVSHGQTLTVTYDDADTGGGSPAQVTDDAAVDCAGPVISGVAVSNVGSTSATVSWTTDEPGTSYAAASPGGSTAGDPGLVTAHTLDLVGLDMCTVHTIEVSSVDALGNAGTPVVSAAFQTSEDAIALEDDVESGPGAWTVDTAIDPGTGTLWSIVSSAAHSPTSAWFSSDEADVKDDRLVIGPLSLGDGVAELSFWHHFNTESTYDGGVLEVSLDGSTWQDIKDVGGVILQGDYTMTLSTGWGNPLPGRQAWSGDSGDFIETVVDMSALSGQNLWLRFRLGCDEMVSDVGWWIDDVLLVTTAPCGDVFVDGFETGDCTMWATVVGLP